MLLEERGEGGGEECLRQPRMRESKVVVGEYGLLRGRGRERGRVGR